MNGTAPASSPAKPRRFLKSKTARETLKAYLFMAPALIMLAVFVFTPILLSLPLMFFDYSVLGETKWVGWQNFQTAFADRDFRIAILNTIIFVLVVPVIQILSIFLAVLVNQKLRGVTIFRTLFYIPVVTSMVAVSIMWKFIFDPNGIINTLLLNGGVIKTPLGFLADRNTALLCLMFITIWQGLGYYMMMYLAGLQSLSYDVIEAAMVDGANPFITFFRIKLPMLKPYIWFCTLNSIIAAVSVFDVVFVLTLGGPNNATMVINYYAYKNAFVDLRFGYSAAIGFVQALITGIFGFIVYIYGRKGEEE